MLSNEQQKQTICRVKTQRPCKEYVLIYFSNNDILVHADSVFAGRTINKVAQKAFSSVIVNLLSDDDQGILFGLVESKSGHKQKNYAFWGKKQKLDEPIIIPPGIIYEYENVVEAIDEINCLEGHIIEYDRLKTFCLK